MKTFNHFFLITLLTSLTMTPLCFASSEKIEIINPQIRLTPPVSKTSAIFLKIKNNLKQKISLTKVTGDLSNSIELHEMKMENGNMEMRAVDSVEIPANTIVELRPGGLHIMLFDLKKSLKKDDTHSFILYFSNDTKIEVKAVVTDFNN